MAVLEPEHLFEQADRLIKPPPAGPPRQVDVRRAISAAYYGVFHFVLRAAADQYVGVTRRGTPQYALVYRSVQHGALKELCLIASRPSLPARYVPYVPAAGLGKNLSAFATAAIDLQSKRHAADYDPLTRVKTDDAKLAITTAREAVRRFGLARPIRQEAFLALLLFPPRT